jgi:hypothetical protein
MPKLKRDRIVKAGEELEPGMDAWILPRAEPLPIDGVFRAQQRSF